MPLATWPRVIYERPITIPGEQLPNPSTADQLGHANSVKLPRKAKEAVSKVRPMMSLPCRDNFDRDQRIAHTVGCFALGVKEKTERIALAKLNAKQRKEMLGKRKKEAEMKKSMS